MPSPASDPTKLVGFAVYNGFNPKEKPKALAVNLDFTAAAVIPIDLTIAEQEGRFRFVQAVYIDNSLNPSPLSLTVGLTQQTVTMPPYSQGYLPILCPNPAKLVASLPIVAAGNVATIIQFLNFPVPAAIWKVSQGARRIISAGGVLGSAAGIKIPLLNNGIAKFIGGSFILTTTATAGNRALRLQFSDAVGNALQQAASANSIVAAIVAQYTIGETEPNALIGTAVAPITTLGMAVPQQMFLPPLSSVTIFDLANIDIADTITVANLWLLDTPAFD